ncbi:helix-turn-helix transcriptional regulator [Nocardia sp. NPDC051030]|uniref:helix-turn-helix transcriptional regulator n=1 Tax=Nocardia sp. NPDC051030 TaxID=3155162 RepID=UPI00343A6157
MTAALPVPSLADFLKWRRQQLGMTRKELGDRAILHEGTIRKLESGERKGIGDAVLESLAVALELGTADERRHLSDLTRVHLERAWMEDDLEVPIGDTEHRALAVLMPQPAACLNERWDVLATNDAYERLHPGISAAGNLMRWLFTPNARAVLIDWEGEIGMTIAGMRAMMGHFGNPAWGVRLLSEMQDDPDFARSWLERRVLFHRPLDSMIHVHTEAGPVSIATQFRAVPDRPDNLHMAIGFPQPYSGPPELLDRG